MPTENARDTGASEPPAGTFLRRAGYLRQQWQGRALLMVVAALLLGCCAIATIHTPMSSVEVEVDLYSGRENPAWKLGETDAARFLTLVAALPYNGTIAPAVPDGLGYRGLRVDVNSRGVAQRFVIANGNAIAEFTKTIDRRNLRDPDRALEKWLLKTGKEKLGVELLEYLLAN